jgi:hypothetical protein
MTFSGFVFEWLVVCVCVLLDIEEKKLVNAWFVVLLRYCYSILVSSLYI